MAKKKRKQLIKLNNRIREYFGGKPFDEGIVGIDDDRLLRLSIYLGLDTENLERESLLRALRRFWSEGGYRQRKILVEYLIGEKRKPLSCLRSSVKLDGEYNDKIEKIEYLLEDIELDHEEESRIFEIFLDMKNSRITREKILNKLRYLRRLKRVSRIEKECEIEFGADDKIEFVHSYTFDLSQYSFSKLLVTRSGRLDIDTLLEQDDEYIIKKISDIKRVAIEQKEAQIKEFLESQENNIYMSEEEIYAHIRRLDSDGELRYNPVNIEIVERIAKNIDRDFFVVEAGDHFLIEKPQKTNFCGEDIRYRLKLSYDKKFIYSSVWLSEKLPFLEDMESLKEKTLSLFDVNIVALKERMEDMSEGLDISDDLLCSMIVRFLEPHILKSGNLKIKEKTKRTILYHFNEHIKPLKEKKQREELLAGTIRDFKRLFPVARALERKIVFHVGPTNSGKTYSALERLKRAETGYYLAPLRLLALEGYEDMKKDGVAVSLITGEEEIIDEDSTHVSSTIEMLNSEIEVDCCVIDEIQMLDDRDRGWAWVNALIGAPAKEVILTGSSNALHIVRMLCKYLDEELEIVEFKRKNPLELMKHPVSVKKIKPSTAIVVFSRKEVLQLKQQLSGKYRVSVVYGNLSPEVRREEARRFREGQSDVLVATDAIAMGLNLPIKTILFGRDNKFDGLKRRELNSSEILQIAGRAGRFGLHEHGYVGALDKNTLKTITEKFNSPLPDIEAPLSVMATLEHVMLIGKILETHRLYEILDFFAQNMEFEGPFVAANIESMLEVAAIVDEYDLDLASRYHLACAPVSMNSPYIESVYHRYLTRLEKDKPVRYIPPRDLPPYAHTNEELLNAEDRVKEVSLYLWLSFRFSESFPDTELAKKEREKLNAFIERSLRKGNFVKRCAKCGKELDFTYRYSICERCYTMGKRGTRHRHSKKYR